MGGPEGTAGGGFWELFPGGEQSSETSQEYSSWYDQPDPQLDEIPDVHYLIYINPSF